MIFEGDFEDVLKKAYVKLTGLLNLSINVRTIVAIPRTEIAITYVSL